MITKKLSYYFDIEDCVYLNNTEDIYYFPLDENLLVELKSGDPDWFREAKLIYNDKIQTLIKTNVIRFISFEKRMFPALQGDSNKFNSIKSPKELFAYYLFGIDNIEDYMSSDELSFTSKDEIMDRYVESYKERIQRIPSAVSDMKMLLRTITRI